MKLHQMLTALAARQDMSQRALIDAMTSRGVYVTPPAMSRYLNGQRPVPGRVIRAVLDVCGVEPADRVPYYEAAL